MAGSQLQTSVTILNSLKGFQAVSLTEYNTSAAASIAAGSVVEIAGAFFTFVADEAINASSWTSIVTGTSAYITLTPSGTAGSQIVDVAYTATAPTWRDDHQGWYASAASNVRVIGSVYKAEAANYGPKYIINSQDYYRDYYRFRGIVETIISGSGNWIVPAGVARIRVTCVGGGGGGGGALNTAGGGGGGGGTNINLAFASNINVFPGQSIAYSVGTGGSGGGANSNGSNGNQTTFVGATTGLGGSGGKSAGNNGCGGDGAAGNSAAPGNNSGGIYSGMPGVGGSGGGNGGFGAIPPNNNGSTGGFGGGGGGGAANSGAGGNGGSGIIIIEY